MRSIFNSALQLSILVFIKGSLALTLGALVGCTTASERLERKLRLNEPVSRVYFAPYEDVEIALKHAMVKYPQRIDNTAAGIFETDFIKGEARFKPAHEEVEYSSGYRYRILVRLVKGRTEKTPAVKVMIVKRIEIVRDFFSDPEQVASDGLEEEAILYRIDRELELARALRSAAQ